MRTLMVCYVAYICTKVFFSFSGTSEDVSLCKTNANGIRHCRSLTEGKHGHGL